MTICVSVKVAEGLVLAADSALMLEGSIKTPEGEKSGILQTFGFANKITRLKDYPVGIMSWGTGNIGDRSIQSLIMEFEYGYPEREKNKNHTVKAIADEILSFIKERYYQAYDNELEKPELGIFAGGYSAGEFFADEYSYVFPQSEEWEIARPNMPDGRPSFGPNWFGMTDALNRLIKGYDPNALKELVKRGVDKTIIQKWIDDGVSELRLIFDGMPLQDAIDFAEYAVQVVIGRYRFEVGPSLCGGDIDIAVITPRAFQWAKRKQWSIK